MGKTDKEKSDQTDNAQKKAQEDELSKRLEAVAEQAKKDSIAGRLLADPDIQSVVKLKNAGKKVTVSEGGGVVDQARSKPAEDGQERPSLSSLAESTDDVDSLSNAELMKLVERGLVGTVEKVLGDTLAPLKEGQRKLEERHQASQEQEANSTIATLRAKYPDFDKFRDQMIGIDRQAGGSIPPERVYLLAKLEAGSPVKPNSSLETETPTPSPSRHARRKEKDEDAPTRSGRRGFEDLLESVDVSLEGFE